MTLIRLDLRGLKCPLPALRTRKALATATVGSEFSVECTDPLAVIDIPALLNTLGDTLLGKEQRDGLLVFHIRREAR